MSSELIITRRDRLDLQNRSWMYVIKQKDILFPPDVVYICAYFLAFKGSGDFYHHKLLSFKFKIHELTSIHYL
jgi:hypothetical protein